MRNQKQILTIPEAASFCGVNRVTLWRWVKSGSLKTFVTPGGHNRIRCADLDAFMAENEIPRPVCPVNSGERPKSDMPRILVVDDDLPIRNLIAHILKGEQYNVETAEDGFDAGIKTVQFNPDLIILDLYMPKLDGFAVCQKIKNSADTRHIKILVITGFDTPQIRRRIKQEGSDAYLPKPIEKGNLISTVKRLLPRAVPERAN